MLSPEWREGATHEGGVFRWRVQTQLRGSSEFGEVEEDRKQESLERSEQLCEVRGTW